MNSYIKTNWVNGSAPALSADNLNKIENGIEAVTNAEIDIEEEVHAARGSHQTLKARLDDTGAPTDEQVAEAVEGYIDNHQEAIVKKAIIANTEMLSPDITFEANNDDVNDYLTASAYVFTADNAYNSNDYQSTNVPADIGSSVNERPNHGTVTIPEGGAKITLIDTVAKIKWSESVSGGDYEVKNLIPNRLYTYVIKNSSGAVIKTGSCKASGQVRIIDAGKAVTYPVSDPTTTSERPLFNIRDLGGWACDGGRLKYGLIYRGCRLNGSYMNNNSVRYGISITESQKAFFKNFLGIRDEIDLRQIKNDPDSGNTETAGDDAIYGTSDDITDTALGVGVDYAIYPIKPYYAGMLSGNAVQNSRYAAIINRIAYDIKNSKPCYVHCLEGADRTGMIAMLILGICGVSRSDIERDYELTSFSKDYIGNRNRRARNDSALSYRWMTLMQHLLGNTTGSTFRDKIIDYVIKIGVTVDEINTIRAGLIDGSPEKIKSPYADAAIQYNLTNIITDNPISSIALYQPFEAKLTALNMTDIQSVTVMMGGTDITSTAYNAERILIPKVTGDITITASATDVAIPDVSGKADKATTLAGYGITNAYTKSEVDSLVETNVKSAYEIAVDHGYTGTEQEWIASLHAANPVVLPLSVYSTEASAIEYMDSQQDKSIIYVWNNKLYIYCTRTVQGLSGACLYEYRNSASSGLVAAENRSTLIIPVSSFEAPLTIDYTGFAISQNPYIYGGNSPTVLNKTLISNDGYAGRTAPIEITSTQLQGCTYVAMIISTTQRPSDFSITVNGTPVSMNVITSTSEIDSAIGSGSTTVTGYTDSGVEYAYPVDGSSTDRYLNTRGTYLVPVPRAYCESQASYEAGSHYLSKYSYSVMTSMFSSLAAANPSYITETTLGKDQSNAYDIKKYVLDAPSSLESGYTSALTNHKPVMIITAGLHGVEPDAVHEVYHFMDDLCNHYMESDELLYLHNNVKFVIVPISNPWGYVNQSYHNSRDVDINKNFEYGYRNNGSANTGAAAYSEAETQILKGVFDEYPEALFHLECHGKYGEDTAFNRTIWFSLMSSLSSEMIEISADYLNLKIGMRLKELGYNTNNSTGGYMTYYGLNGRPKDYTGTKYGILSATMEGTGKIYGESGYSVNTQKINTEALENFLLTVLSGFESGLE